MTHEERDMNMHNTSRRGALITLTLVLAPFAATAQPREQDEGRFRILQARYGTARHNVDVTQRLRELARADGQIRISNKTFGGDPDQGVTKTVRIFARGPNGRTRTFEYAEGDVIDGARFVGWGGGRWGQSGYRGGWGHDEERGGRDGGGDGGEYRIVQALYGTKEHNVDVTPRLRELARSDQTFRLGNDTFGVDPDKGHRKTLRIQARGPDGQTRMFEYTEGSPVDGSRFTGWSRGDWGQDGQRPGWGDPRLR
jgi:hypothetical protein